MPRADLLTQNDPTQDLNSAEVENSWSGERRIQSKKLTVNNCGGASEGSRQDGRGGDSAGGVGRGMLGGEG